MRTTTSNVQERRFATTQRVRTPSPRYTVRATSAHGSCDHEFVDLQCAVQKVKELLTLGIPHVSIDLSTQICLPSTTNKE